MTAKPVGKRGLNCALLVWLLSTVGISALLAQSPVSEPTRNIVAARDQVVEYARDIKVKFPESDPVWQGARTRYRKAYAEFNAYIATVKAAIASGKTKDLEKDPTYQKAAEEATNCSKEFIRFVQLKTATRSRDIALINTLFNEGSRIFNGIQAGKAQRRAQDADAFEKAVMWPRWEDIKQ